VRRLAGLVAVLFLLLAAPVVATHAAPAAPSASPFSVRGVIEGFYGPSWTHAARMSELAWMGAHGMNTYVHAPKNDSWQRANWRDPYPPADLADYADEIRAAGAAGVAWFPNMSPGLPLIPGQPAPGVAPSRDVCFSCPADVGAIEAKLDPFYAAGARVLMVSFDDVQKASSHPEDAAAYGTGDAAYGHMNRDLLNTIYRHYRDQAAAGGESFTLLTVLADYSGTADTTYLSGVRSGGGLDPGINVMWTGTATVSKTISASDAAAYASHVGRQKVAIWDNYPVNDYTGNIAGKATRLFLGPYEGRAADLPTSVSGILANPMNEAFASRVALGTVAAYLNDPASYAPETAWRASIGDLAGGDPALTDAVAAFAENSRSSGLDRTESPVFTAARDAFLAAYDDGPFWPATRDPLSAETGRERRAPSAVRAGLPDFATDAGPWLDRLAANATTADQATTALAATRPALKATATAAAVAGFVHISGRAAPPSPVSAATAVAALGADEAASLVDWHAVHGDRFGTDLSTVYVNENRVDAYVHAVSSRYASWLPKSPLAATGVTVTVAGRPVAIAPDGSFAVDVPAPAAGIVDVVATDRSDGSTGVHLAT